MTQSSFRKLSLESWTMTPVCCICKRTRTLDNTWEKMELPGDIEENIEITHGFCPECVKLHYPFVYDD